MIRIGNLAVLSLAAVAAPVGAEEFTFGWKPGLTCAVRNRLQKQEKDMTLTYVLRASAGREGNLVIDVEKPDAEIAGKPSTSAQEKALGEQLVALNMPSFEVDGEGTLVGLKDLEGTQRALRAMIELKPDLDKQRVDEVMKQIATRELLENVVSSMWNPAVYSWAGVSLEPNEPVENTVEAALPIGNIPVTMKTSAEYTGLVACSPGDQKKCARLVTEQIPEPKSFEKAVIELAGKFGGSMEGVRFEKVDIRTVTETITDPATLIPVLVIMERVSTLRVVDKGKADERVQRDRREWQFTCTP